MKKGVILAAGKGTRLRPLTKVVDKIILPVYNKPLVYYPIVTLRDAGIKDILVIVSPGRAGQFVDLLGSGKNFDVKLSYEVQEEQKGIAHGLALAQDFADDGPIALILGDNIYEDNFKDAVSSFDNLKKGARVFLKEVHDPQRFGVARFNEKNPDRIAEIIEKPQDPPTNWAVTGFYLYDKRVWEVIKGLKPSARGEYEITDVNNFYVKEGTMTYVKAKGEWIDAGTFDSLLRAGNLVAHWEGKVKN